MPIHEARTMPNKVNFAIVGCGNMGGAHLDNIMSGKIPNADVTAVCDIDENVLSRVYERYSDIKCCRDYTDLASYDGIDAVIVATPHYIHPEIAVYFLQNGKHVLVEKPIGIMPSDIERLVRVAEESDKKFAIMFNQRTNPLFMRAHDIMQSGEIGALKRVVWTVTNWYRTQSYYDSGGWRGTFRLEGGGVLTNQAPHQLDLMQWICGMPKAVTAFCTAGKYHNITVEDDATLYFEYENGATGLFITTTGDACGVNRLEISCDKGKMVLESGVLKLYKHEVSEREFCFTEKNGFYQPPIEYSEYTEKESVEGHIAVLRNFCNAILSDEPLIACGSQGANQASITAAAYLSWFTGERQTIPVDAALYEAELEKRYEDDDYIAKRLESIAKPKGENHSDRWQVRW